MNDEVFHASDGEHGKEGFEDEEWEIDPADLGIQMRKVG